MGKPETPLLTADCVIFDGDDRVLLVRRRNEPFAGKLALPGGFVNTGETLESGCRREVGEETGLTLGRLRLVGVYSDPKRDPRGHACSVAFVTRVRSAEPRAGDDAAAVEWRSRWRKDELAFDHHQIISDARAVLASPPSKVRAR